MNVLRRIYLANFFPEMKARWDAYPGNGGHLGFPGCARCHDGRHHSDDGGRTITPEFYAAALGLVAGFLATLYCRPDLWARMFVSGDLFLFLYVIFLYVIAFALFNLAFPGYVAAVWNLPALSGVLVVGVPLEELLFARTAAVAHRR